MTINADNLNQFIILDSSNSYIRNYSVDNSNNLLIYDDEYIDICYNGVELTPIEENSNS